MIFCRTLRPHAIYPQLYARNLGTELSRSRSDSGRSSHQDPDRAAFRPRRVSMVFLGAEARASSAVRASCARWRRSTSGLNDQWLKLSPLKSVLTDGSEPNASGTVASAQR